MNTGSRNIVANVATNTEAAPAHDYFAETYPHARKVAYQKSDAAEEEAGVATAGISSGALLDASRRHNLAAFAHADAAEHAYQNGHFEQHEAHLGEEKYHRGEADKLQRAARRLRDL